jgi:mRNA interferase MazF
MRAIHLARLDKIRPVLVLTRDIVIPHLTRVTVAPITGRIRGLRIEVPVGQRNGLDKDSVVNLDNIQTIAKTDLLHRLGWFSLRDEPALTAALVAAFDLEDPPD